MEVEPLVALQGKVRLPDLVQPRDQGLETSGAGEVPGFDLVFFRVEVFFAVGLHGRIVSQLEGRSIDTVVGAHRSCENEAAAEGGQSTCLQMPRQNVGSIGPEIRPEILLY